MTIENQIAAPLRIEFNFENPDDVYLKDNLDGSLLIKVTFFNESNRVATIDHIGLEVTGSQGIQYTGDRVDLRDNNLPSYIFLTYEKARINPSSNKFLYMYFSGLEARWFLENETHFSLEFQTARFDGSEDTKVSLCYKKNINGEISVVDYGFHGYSKPKPDLIDLKNLELTLKKNSIIENAESGKTKIIKCKFNCYIDDYKNLIYLFFVEIKKTAEEDLDYYVNISLHNSQGDMIDEDVSKVSIWSAKGIDIMKIKMQPENTFETINSAKIRLLAV